MSLEGATMRSNHAARIIVVDDDADLGEAVADCLARDGHLVSNCSSGAELDDLLESEAPDLIMLDVTMPDEDGISIARRLTQAGLAIPIIMLTGLTGIVDRVVGLKVGADDYITKPFDPLELGARVHAVLRRARHNAATREAPARPGLHGGMHCFGKAFLDFDRRCLRDRHGEEVPVTLGEFDLLATFARHPNTVLSRERLLGSNSDPGAGDRAIDIRVTRIRKRIEINPAKPQVIRTVRSAGYVYVPPADGP